MNDSSSKLANYPLLRFLLGSKAFRVILVILIVIPSLLVLALAQIWRSTPEGFDPEVKIRAVSMAQAWSLKRGAIKAAEKGQMDRAIYSWRMAVAHNPGDPELSRGLIECILKSGKKEDSGGLALQQSLWLLRLTGTNMADLALGAKVFELYEQDSILLAVLKPMESKLTPKLAGSYLKALFRAGQAEEFDRYWQKTNPGVGQDPELSLYRTAYQAGWGAESVRTPSWQQLDGALAQPAQRQLVGRLSMLASFHIQSVPRYEKAFGVETNLQADQLLDNINRWRLYAAVTNLPKAKQLAQAFTRMPSNALETIILAKTYLQLDLRDKAQQVLKQCVPQFGHVNELWIFYADLLVKERQWDTLLALANEIRQDRRVMRELTGQSYYWEGFAEVAREHRTQAEAAFRRVSEHTLPSPEMVVSIANSMLGLGFPEATKRLLVKYQKEFSKEPRYWYLLYYTAIGLRDETLLLSSAKEVHTLLSTNWQAQYAYAAAMLTLRVQPNDALKLTQEIVRQKPDHIGAKINHSLALIQTGRAQEAQALLKGLDAAKLDPIQANALYEAQFELYLALREFGLALQVGARLNRNLMFPSEAKWYDRELKQISPPKKA